MIHQPPGMGARPAENERPWASAEAAPGFSGGGSHAAGLLEVIGIFDIDTFQLFPIEVD